VEVGGAGPPYSIIILFLFLFLLLLLWIRYPAISWLDQFV
jgi:hypothetical protein